MSLSWAINLRSLVWPSLGTQSSWDLGRVQIRCVDLSHEALSFPVIRPDKVGCPAIAADEPLVSLNHPDRPGKLSPAGRILPNQGISHLPRSKQLGMRRRVAQEQHGQR
ncbi:MAG: hypothetical protein ACK56J_00410 [Planctomycetota bacterium]|nr:hypothetical protein [Blastopirellula sp.]